MKIASPFAAWMTFGLALAGSMTPPVAAQSPGMVEFFSFGKVQQGIPLLSTASEIVLLGRDGWMHAIDPKSERGDVNPIEKSYEPMSAMELRNELRSEYGPQFEVLSTQNFLVVQPNGRGQQWAQLFEQSHQGFVDYMTRRGVDVRQSNFPMVAIVMPDETAMYAEMERLGVSIRRVAGVYTGLSNRVVTHDNASRSETQSTVRHEAAHQSAFNTGVHSRVSETPKWISEGVGQMFEPAGMTNLRVAAAVSDRINQDSLKVIRSRFDNRENYAKAVMSLIRDDSAFADQSSVYDAYAVSWSMMFYLAERQPEKFAALLNQTSSRQPFIAYPVTERQKDFQKIIGDPLDFINGLSRFMQSL
jgi:Protein of unknown function (DUF1570)